MRAGALDTLITIQRKAPGVDDWGQPLPDGWADVATVWADIKHLSGIESIKADANTSVVSASIRLRRRTDIDAGMRVSSGARVYDIEAVLPGRKRDYMDLRVKQVT